jgi:hypothetical protein
MLFKASIVTEFSKIFFMMNPVFHEPYLSLSSGKLICLSLLRYTCLKPWLLAGGETKRVSRWSQVSALLGPAFRVVIGDRAWLSMKPPPLLKLFSFRCISIAFMRWSNYPDILLRK